MPQDEIIKEVRAIREAYAERFGFDVRALFVDAKAGEGKGQRRVVALKPRRTEGIEEEAPRTSEIGVQPR